MSPAHPRSRGENIAAIDNGSWRGGSSPLTRGKPCARVGETVGGGLIPAHAGKTGWDAGADGDLGAHPRSRGENRDGVIDRLSIGGSSPLTRGKRIHRSRQRHLPGLIPAHAGKTEAVTAVSVFEWAHPRSRGENFRLRMRAPVQGGLIPAHAGKTRTARART